MVVVEVLQDYCYQGSGGGGGYICVVAVVVDSITLK